MTATLGGPAAQTGGRGRGGSKLSQVHMTCVRPPWGTTLHAHVPSCLPLEDCRDPCVWLP